MPDFKCMSHGTWTFNIGIHEHVVYTYILITSSLIQFPKKHVRS